MLSQHNAITAQQNNQDTLPQSVCINEANYGMYVMNTTQPAQIASRYFRDI